jgi:hypothetical protein
MQHHDDQRGWEGERYMDATYYHLKVKIVGVCGCVDDSELAVYDGDSKGHGHPLIANDHAGDASLYMAIHGLDVGGGG